MSRKCVVSVAMLLIVSSLFALTAGQYPFRNISLSWEERVKDLVNRLTLEEITLQMSRGGSGPVASPAPPIGRLGIKPYSWDTECLRGDVVAGNATSFPQALGLAATFSPDLVFRVAEATGEEVRAKYNNYTKHSVYGDHKGISCFSPVINIARDPRWGRNQETYGEDPYLSGVLASSFVRGLQGNHPRYIRANAGCKHFDVYGGPENIPVSSFSFDAKVTERDWRITFLPAFRQCVAAGTYNIMCSFNSINGVPACANKQLLTDVLRHEWGFKGYVITDQSAVEYIINKHHYLNNSVDTATACVKAGVNLELSTNLEKPVFFSIIDALKQGKLTEAEVRDRASRLFYTRMRLGEFDPPDINPYTKLNLSLVQSKAHRALSVEAALKSIVLLKNINRTLPIITAKQFQVAVVGPMANNSAQLFGDYAADIDPYFTRTPLQGLQVIWPDLRYGAGCKDTRCAQYDVDQVKQAVTGAHYVFVCLGTGQELESEGNDKADLQLPGHQQQLLEDAVTAGTGAKVILLLFNAGPLNVTWAYENPNVHGILELFFPAQATGETVIRVITASGLNSVPAGRLPMTWPKYMNDVPPITDYSMDGRTYRYSTAKALFPFGYGLSYTVFFYRMLDFPTTVKAGQDLRGSVSVLNQGLYSADEVIQVYISWTNASVPVPRLQLVDLHRVFISKGGSALCNFSIQAESMAVWTDHGWVVEQGTISFWVGGQQPIVTPRVDSNILSASFRVLGTKKLGKY